MGVSKNRGKPPKMDGENNEKNDLGCFPPIFGSTPISGSNKKTKPCDIRFCPAQLFGWLPPFLGVEKNDATLGGVPLVWFSVGNFRGFQATTSLGGKVWIFGRF